MTKELKPQLVDIDWIKPYPNNAKVHDEAQVKKIAESIKKFGWTTAIVVDKNGEIIAGHGRRLAAIKLGQTKVPVLIRDDLNEEEVKALRLADNRVALSGFDGEMIKKELAEINFDMLGIFDSKELDFLNADLAKVDETAFMTDVDTAVRQHAAETAEKVSTIDEKPVAIAKALGFKTIKTKEEKYVASFIALVEGKTGKQGAEAFVDYCRTALLDS